jgi:pantetheine-phosphate adenylyltransferase, bacterial
MTVAVYPGSFDPITNGHLDIVARAATVFERLVVAVLANPKKAPLLSVEERIDVIRAALTETGMSGGRIDVTAFDGLTVDFAKRQDATAIVRGLRAISDFETEMQLAHNNRVLAPGIDTIFFMTSAANSYVSSSLVKEIASFGATSRAWSRPPRAKPWLESSSIAERPARAIIRSTGGSPTSTSSSSSSASNPSLRTGRSSR